MWRDRPTLVTGATGLVGGWVVRQLLNRQARVVCLIRDWQPDSDLIRDGVVERVVTVRGDLTDQALHERVLNEYEIATVIHLGAQTIVPIANRNPVSTFESNIRGTWSLLEACRRSPIVEQVIVASSDKAYGSQATLPYSEDSPLQGRYPYDASKACTDLIAQSYASTFGLPVAITRCGNFYGGGDLNWSRIVPGTIRSLLRGERPIIRSDGRFIRDYFYVEDGAAAYLVLAEQLARNPTLGGEAFNFSYECPMSVLEIVQRISATMGVEAEPDIRNEATREIPSQHLDSRKARTLLNWQPTVGFDEGLSRTIAWYRASLGNRAQP